MGNRIKIAMVATNLGLNGISSVIMNYCRNMDLKRFEITILAGEPIDDTYNKECKDLGVKIITLPARKPTTAKYYFSLLRSLSKNKYDILHIHGNSSAIAIDLFMGFIRGIKIRVAHCHNAKCTNLKAHKLLLPIFNCLYTYGFACSTLAGEWLFENRKFTIIPNGFNVEKFKLNTDVRKETRNKIGIQEGFIIGHVGRFNSQKNQTFLLDVFKIVAREKKNTWLLLVGNGPDFEKVKEIVKAHPYRERIIMYGETLNAVELYDAMDLFVFPSKHEGLGIAMLEAQINGLRCIAANTVPKDVVISNNVEFIDIGEKNINIWADSIIKKVNEKSKREEVDVNDVKIQQFNIVQNVKLLEKKYLEMLENRI